MSLQMEHGGGLDRACAVYGGKPADWLDLSTGINPIAYPHTGLSQSALCRLPDREANERLLMAARQYYGVPDHADIVALNGTQAAIQLLPELTGSKHVAVLSPTYNEYSHVFAQAGIAVSEYDGGQVPEGADTAVLVNPNNPDGRLFDIEHVTRLASRIAETNGWLVVDEAFMDCFPDESIVPILPEYVMVLRSFGKFFGLAGLRLGFLIGSKGICERALRLSGPWSVSGPALMIGERALADSQWIAAMRDRLVGLRDELIHVLKVSGFEINGSTPLYVFARHPDAEGVYETLARQHILVRRFDAMPQVLRFGLCPDEGALAHFSKALIEIGQRAKA